MNSKVLSLDGLTGKLAGLELGASAGLPLLAVHGWLDNAASFIPLADRLNQYRWLCLDMPGHGDSEPRPRGCVYHFTDYIGDLYCALETLQMDKCDLVGHSLGAGIVAAFAAAFPDRVNRLVLIDGIGPVFDDDDHSLMQLRKSMAFLRQKPIAGERWYPSWEELVEKRLAAGDIERQSVEVLLSRGARCDTNGKGVKVLSDSRLKQHSPIYLNQEKVLSILSGIEAKTLLIIADQGLIAKHDSTQKCKQAIQNLTTVTVPGAHHVHLDNPQSVAAEIRHFLE